MKKIRAAIVGYGNIGKYVLEALEAAPDFEVAGIIRRNPNDIPDELKGYTVTDTITKLDKVDVAVLATPTRSVEEHAKEILALGINTVDSFDIHGGIVDLRRSLDAVAKAHNTVAVISAGWDPGSDSVVRALLEAMVPKGITYTNFGPGMSMGHTVAVKAIEGVKAALSMTIPLGTGVHRRMVYIEVEDGERLIRAVKREKEQETPKYEELCRRFLADQEDFSEEKIKEAGISRRFENDDLDVCVRNITDFINYMS